MNEPTRCPTCNTELPPGTPPGLCPGCLLKAGLESQPAASGDPGPTAASPSVGFVPPTVETVAAKFPQLEILELLGKGGMGAVYKARQKGLDRLVAVKILPAEVSQAAGFTERFTREARALARLNHPNIVSVHDFGQADGLCYFVMEYVDGVNLRQAMQVGSMDPQQALAIVPQICDALQFAHGEGVVHRDIKPENILIDKRGRIKIADFGLAKLLGQGVADHALTASQQVMGTLRYMAPEQMEGLKEVDHRADIFSLGVVFYELLTGELPVGRFAPPSRKVYIDVRLDEVVLRALEKEPEQRYQHASEVKTAIEQMSVAGPVPNWQSGGLPGAIPPSLLPGLMATAIGGVFGSLTMAIGVALAAYAVLAESPQTGEFWGWVGGAFGCFFGGGGALIGAINSYRQIAGETDLMTAPGWNWLDRVLCGYALLGLVPVVAAVTISSLGPEAQYSMWLLGAIVFGQSVLFWALRWPRRRIAPPGKQADDQSAASVQFTSPSAPKQS